ncbi:MAG: restriction endonuclease subunit S [Ideonella sp.]|nr:restriction endonuclease subunit S [Ideonella sp.]
MFRERQGCASLGCRASRRLRLNSACRPSPNDKVDAGYLAQFFKTPSYRRTISSLAAGANINNLKSEHLDDLLIPLPPFPEQRRIAAILDQADALRAKRREALAQLDSLTQSIFIEMFGDPIANPLGWALVEIGDFAGRFRAASR